MVKFGNISDNFTKSLVHFLKKNLIQRIDKI